MEINKLNKIAFYTALVWAVLATIFVVFSFGEGKNPYGPISIIHHGAFAFYLLLSGLMIRAFFKDLPFSFKEALLFGVIISVGGSFLFMLFGLFYLNSTWDTNMPIYVANMTGFFEKMFESGELEKVGEVSEKGMTESIEKLKSVTAWNIAFNDFSIKMIISLILSFIIAVVMRKSNPELEVK